MMILTRLLLQFALIALGIPTIVLGRIWPKLMRKLASSLAGRPMPVGV